MSASNECVGVQFFNRLPRLGLLEERDVGFPWGGTHTTSDIAMVPWGRPSGFPFSPSIWIFVQTPLSLPSGFFVHEPEESRERRERWIKACKEAHKLVEQNPSEARDSSILEITLKGPVGVQSRQVDRSGRIEFAVQIIDIVILKDCIMVITYMISVTHYLKVVR